MNEGTSKASFTPRTLEWTMRRIDHIGIAVEDLEAALAPYVDGLGMVVDHVEEVPTERVRIAMLPIGDTKLELLEPQDPESAIAKFIERRGPGIHHIALAVEDVAASIESLKAAGVRLIDEEPRPGAGGTRVAFAHPKGFNGVLLELVEGGHL